MIDRGGRRKDQSHDQAALHCDQDSAKANGQKRREEPVAIAPEHTQRVGNAEAWRPPGPMATCFAWQPPWKTLIGWVKKGKLQVLRGLADGYAPLFSFDN